MRRKEFDARGSWTTFDATGTDAGTDAGTVCDTGPDNKLCLHVGHVLFARNHRAKLFVLNMCPHCRMRETR